MHPAVKAPASVGGGNKCAGKSTQMQLDMSALATFDPYDAPDGALSPEKCPSPLQLTPKHSAAQQTTASLTGCFFDQYSNSSINKHQRPGEGTLTHLAHSLNLQKTQQCSSPAYAIQLQERSYLSVPSAPVLTPATINQNELSCSMQCDTDPSISRDDILMDFWALLQQTQQNLQDMLVDLETAKIELDLSNGRADEAENNADALKIQLAAAQQKNNALEGQVQHLQSRGSEASSKASTLTQRNTELSVELRQAQKAAATLELKLERMQLQVAAAHKEKAAAAAQAAAAASSGIDPAAVAAQEAAATVAQALVSQLRAELSQTRSDLASSHSRAARAELELAVARTKVLVAQQEASESADRCSRVEAENTTLKQQLGVAAATAEVAAADKQKLEHQIELLTLKIEQKESRLRNSMNNLARASTSLRASFNAQGGMFATGMLRSASTHLTAGDIVRKSADIKSLLRASQQQQQQHQKGSIAEDSSNSSSSNGSASSPPSGMLTPQACPPIPDELEMSAAGGRYSDMSDSKSVTDSDTMSSQDFVADFVAVAGRQDLPMDSTVRTSSPFAAVALQDGRNDDRSSSSSGSTDAIIQPHSSIAPAAAVTKDTQQSDIAAASSGSRGQSIAWNSSNQGVNRNAVMDRQSPIFKRRPSAAGRSSAGGNSSQSILSPSPGSSAGTAAVTRRSQQGKATTSSAGLPPRPRRTSSSGVSADGKSPVASPRNTLGFSLSPAGSSTPNLRSPGASKRSSSCGSSGSSGSIVSAAAAQLSYCSQYEPNSSNTNKAQGRRCGSSSTGLAAALGDGSTECMVYSDQAGLTAGDAVTKDEAREVAAETGAAERESAMAGTEAAAICAEPGCRKCTTATAAPTQDDASGLISASTAQWPQTDSAANTAAGSSSASEAAATVTACVEALGCKLRLHNAPIPDSPSAAAAAKVALLPAALISPPRSPMASRHVCKITQFAALGTSTAAESSSSGSIGPVSAAIAGWQSQAVTAAAAGSKDHAVVGVEPAASAEGMADASKSETQRDSQPAVALAMPGTAGTNACAALASAPAAGSALSNAAEEGGRAAETAVEDVAADAAGDPATQPEVEPATADTECLTAAEPDDRPSTWIEQDGNASNYDDECSDAAADSEASFSSSHHSAASEAGLADGNINTGPAASAAAASINGSGGAGPRLANTRTSRVPRHSIQRWLAAALLPASSVVVGALFLSVGLTPPTKEPTAHQTVPQSAASLEDPALEQ